MTQFILTDQAEDDLIGIAEELAESAGESAGLQIFDRIYKAADLLGAYPELGPQRQEVDAGLRVFPTEEHLILYRIEESIVKIVRVVHQRQDISKLFGTRRKRSR